MPKRTEDYKEENYDFIFIEIILLLFAIFY